MIQRQGSDEDDDEGNIPADVRRMLRRIERTSRPRRERVVSEQKPPKKKKRQGRRPEAGEAVASAERVSGAADGEAPAERPPRWDRERVHGYELARRPPGNRRPSRKAARRAAQSAEHHEAAARAVEDAIAELREERGQRKREITAHVYAERGRFGAGLSRQQLRRQSGGPEFVDELFGESGSYVPDLRRTQLTSASVLARANENLPEDAPRLKARNSASSAQTHLTLSGRRIYTLHRGASAFVPAGRARASGRQVLRKRGSDNEYVRDDRGVPTRRFAYAVKSGAQVGRMAEGTTLRGRFALPSHPVFGDAPRTLASASHAEIAELGRQPPRGERFGELSPDELLYMHQEFGSGDRQRGVSISSTPSPLLSNEARGFADDDEARKLRIDLGSVPRARKRAVPNAVAFHRRISGQESRRVVAPALHAAEGVPDELRGDGGVSQEARLAAYDAAVARGGIQPSAAPKYSQARNQRRFEWSVDKNRELFLRQLHRRNLRGMSEVSRLERTDLEGMDEEGIADELSRVKRTAREGEAAQGRLRLKKPRGKTRQRRSGPKGRKT